MTFAESAASATKGALCDVVGAFENASRLFSRLPDMNGSARFSTNYWRALNRGLCNKEEPGGNPPPVGGQCPCARYLVKAYITPQTLIFPGNACGPNNQVTVQREVYGPVTSVYIQKSSSSSSSWSIRAVCRGLVVNDPGGNGCKPEAVDRQIATITSSPAGTDGPCPPPSLDNYEFIRNDGQPLDDCDSELGPPLPPAPNFNVININNFTWNNNDGDAIIENLNLEFGFAFQDGNNNIKIPVKLDVGGLTFNADFNLETGDFQFNFDPDLEFDFDIGPINLRQPNNPSGDNPNPGDGTPDRPGDVEPDSDVEEDEDLPGEDQQQTGKIIGVQVISNVSNPSIGKLVQDANPDIRIPNIGFVQFFIATSPLSGAWTADIPVKNTNHYIPCPVPTGAELVRGTHRPGVTWKLRAIYATKAAERVFPTN